MVKRLILLHFSRLFKLFQISKVRLNRGFRFGVLLHINEDVYSASFAAVPHVVRVLAFAPLKADFAYFQFPAWIEFCRLKNEIEVPEDLKTAYFDALSQLPNLVAAASTREWNSDFMASALAAIAVAKGQSKIAEAVLELTPSVAEEFMQWFLER
jgi:hypothetical protein